MVDRRVSSTVEFDKVVFVVDECHKVEIDLILEVRSLCSREREERTSEMLSNSREENTLAHGCLTRLGGRFVHRSELIRCREEICSLAR